VQTFKKRIGTESMQNLSASHGSKTGCKKGAPVALSVGHEFGSRAPVVPLYVPPCATGDQQAIEIASEAAPDAPQATTAAPTLSPGLWQSL
jgi:hypothetical protein